MPDQPLRPIWEPGDFADTVRDAAQHRAYSSVPADLLDDADYLDYLDAAPPIAAPPSWSRGAERYRAPGTAGMRPGRARAIGQACVASAAAILLLVAVVLWIVAVPR